MKDKKDIIMSIAIKLNKFINSFFKLDLKSADRELYDSIESEFSRQQNHIELIASENIVSKAVLEAQGSILTNKYAEGYPGKRYYGGFEVVDEIENIAIDRAKLLFGASYANVQPHSGSPANTAVYHAFIKPGDKILGFDLSHGGHLTHGSPVNFSGRLYNPVFYGVEKDTGILNYDSIMDIAEKEKPKMIILVYSFKHWTLRPENAISTVPPIEFHLLGESKLLFETFIFPISDSKHDSSMTSKWPAMGGDGRP